MEPSRGSQHSPFPGVQHEARDVPHRLAPRVALTPRQPASSRARPARLASLPFGLASLLAVSTAAYADDLPWQGVQPLATGFDGAALVLTADLDRDGLQDVVGVARDVGDLKWWEQQPAGTWTEHDIALGFNEPGGVALGDLDRDGDLDAVVAVAGGGVLVWYENLDGLGQSWDDHLISFSSDGARSPRLADFDLDGDLDIAVLESDDDQVTIWINSDTVFSEVIVDSAFEGGIDLEIADLDADGDPDLIAAALDGDEVAWFENQRGSWVDRAVLATDAPSAIAVLDVDGDADLDIATSSTGGGALILLSRNTGAFWTQSTLTQALVDLEQLDAVDLDRDGDTDLIGASSSAMGLGWWEQDEGDWTMHLVHENEGMAGVAAADVDGDGDFDLLGASTGNNRIGLWTNRDLHRSAVMVARPEFDLDLDRSPGVADLDGDGDDDVFGIRPGSPSSVGWWENTLREGTPPVWRQVFADSNPGYALARVAAVDDDRDGDPDLLGADGEATYLWTNDIPTTVNWPSASIVDPTLALTAGPYRIADFAREGVEGVLAAADTGSGDELVIIPRGFGANAPMYLDSRHPRPDSRYTALADLDRNATLDAIVVHADGSLFWYDNQAGTAGNPFLLVTLPTTELIVHPVGTTLSGDPRGLESGDVDGDGDTDFIGGSDSEIALWSSEVGGLFFTKTVITAQFGGTPSALADLDHDGDLDFLVHDADEDDLWMMLGAGDGTFDARVLFASSFVTGPTETLFSDLDRDGDLDLLSEILPTDIAIGFGWWENRLAQVEVHVQDAGDELLEFEGAETRVLLRFQIDHAGRAGDDDARWSGVELTFRDVVSGTALDLTQLAGHVDRLGLLLDDGDGVPNEDQVIEVWTEWSAAAGQSIRFDLPTDPGAPTLPFGAPSTFWLIAQGGSGPMVFDEIEVQATGSRFVHAVYGTELEAVIVENETSSPWTVSSIFADGFESGDVTAWE